MKYKEEKQALEVRKTSIGGESQKVKQIRLEPNESGQELSLLVFMS